MQGTFRIFVIGEFEFWDLLYSRYANPKELMRTYIKRGRFGEFVENIISAENKRRKEEAEKENEHKLWTMYIHSMSDKSFIDWKKGLIERSKENEPESYSMTNEQVEATIKDTKGILQRISPK